MIKITIKNIKKILIILFYSILLLGINSSIVEATTLDITENQKAIQEVADAYYNRGKNVQYCTFRKSFIYSPEEATSQHTIYSVCSDFTYSVYYQAFGIQLPDETKKIIAYGKEYYNKDNIKTNDVLEYWKKNNNKYIDNNGNLKDIDLSREETKKVYADVILKQYNLQVGDVLCYYGKSGGHALLVYDIIYDKDTKEPINAIIYEANSKYDKNITKISKGLSYDSLGTFNKINLIDDKNTKLSFIDKLSSMSYFTIIRPLTKDENGNYTGKYYKQNFTKTTEEEKVKDEDKWEWKCSGNRKTTEYSINDLTKNRMEYSSIYIEKTVDVFNNSTVDLGDILEYTITVENKSKNKYGSFNITENISEYVEIFELSDGEKRGNTITWNISGLDVGDSIEKRYKVKVKNNENNLGKKIISDGTVAGIPSSTVTNYISKNLNDKQKNTIKENTEKLMNSNMNFGKDLINEIYKKSFNVDLDFSDFKFEELLTSVSVQYNPNTQKYFNKENKYSNWILSNYYGSLNTTGESLRCWENSVALNNYGRSERADTIYKENFETGDILIYKNTQSTNGTYETEEGIYYLIYICANDKITVEEQELYGFIGIDKNGRIKNIKAEFIELQTILGKDYYVIFRPSKVLDIKDINENIDEEIKKENEKEIIEKDTTLADKTIPKAGDNFIMVLRSILFIILISIISIIFILKQYYKRI